MNDFTKSELLIIRLAVVRDMNEFAPMLKTSQSMIELRDKLELMIDNYCEHMNRSCDDSCAARCEDCGKCVCYND